MDTIRNPDLTIRSHAAEKGQNGPASGRTPARGFRPAPGGVPRAPGPVSGDPSTTGGGQYPIATEVAGRMRALRKFRDWSQEQLARQVTQRGYAVKREWLMDFEIGRKREVSVDFVVALAAALHVPVLALLGLVPCRVCDGAPRLGTACSECGAGRPQ